MARLLIATLSLAAAATSAWHGALAAEQDPVVFSFAYVGCNRLDKNGINAVAKENLPSPSTANVAQLLQTFKDVATLQPAPQYLILAGDIVKAKPKKPGTKNLKAQLDAWVKLVPKNYPIPIVAFTGNHELLMSSNDADEEGAEVPNPPAYAYWQAHMRAYIRGSDGPPMGGPDKLLDDETRLSYTFRSGPYLFVVLNTDTQIDANDGAIALNWISTKLAAAQQDRSVQHVFVLGHKPVVAPGTVPPDSGASNIRASQGQAFYNLLNAPGTKVRAYLSAHAHEWNYQPNLSALGLPGTIPQIIAGNGGSPPEGSWKKAKNPYFGYTRVSVTASGRVTAQSYGRLIPKPPLPYSTQSKPSPKAATQQGATVTLYPIKS